MEDGGRARAERDFREFGSKTASSGKITTESMGKDIEESKITPPRSSEEKIRVYVSGYMPQSATPGRCIAEQLQTPPNTLIGKKRERPPSWEADIDLHKEAIWVGDDRKPEPSTGLVPERTCFQSASHATKSAKISLLDADFLDNDPNFDVQSFSHGGPGSTSSDCKISLGYPAGEVGSGDPMFLATESGDDSGASTMLFDERGSEANIAGQDLYPQLPMPKTHGHAKINEVLFHDRTVATELPNAKSDHFSSALDYVSFATSSDCGDFPGDAAVLDHISANGPRTEPRLCAEQLALVDLIMSGENVFYTGSAGSGKSSVLKHIVPLLRKEGKKLDILAPTGRAALEINGRTLHNYAGWVPLSLRKPLRILENDARGKKVQKRLRATDVLIIDEISMVANHVFERLNCIMKSARDSKKPFGGVQMIVTGDFCQLPPVNGFEYCLICGTLLVSVSWEGKYKCVKCSAHFEEIDKWAFRSVAWQKCNFHHVNLKVVHRQKNADFKALLENCRLGKPFSFDERWLLLEHASETRNAVRLLPRKVDVKTINDGELAQLPGRPFTYSCIDDFYWNRVHDTLRDKGDRCPEPMSHALVALEEHFLEPKLVLKAGMLVILLVNWDLDSSLANGSQGTIVGFEKHDPKLFPEVPRDWEYSSRKNGLVKAFVKRTAAQEWPIVQFFNGRRRTIYPRCMMNELGDDAPYSLLSRTQIPLMAAWAMTIHRAQGMTLSRVIVDLSHSFEPGQVYVALSRAETLEGLEVEGLPMIDTGPNKQVIQFLKEENLMPAIDWDECNDAKSEQEKDTG